MAGDDQFAFKNEQPRDDQRSGLALLVFRLQVNLVAVAEGKAAEPVIFWPNQPWPRGSWSTGSPSIGFMVSGIGKGIGLAHTVCPTASR